MKSQKALGAILTSLFILATWGEALCSTGTFTLESAARAGQGSPASPEDVVNTYFTAGERAFVTDLDPVTSVEVEGVIVDPPPDPVGVESQAGWFKFDLTYFDTTRLDSLTFKVNAAVNCAIAPQSDDRYYIDVFRFNPPGSFEVIDVAPISAGAFVEEQITFTQTGNDGTFAPHYNIGQIVSAQNKVYFRVRENGSYFSGPGLTESIIIIEFDEVEISYDYDEGTLINDRIRGLSGSDSCKESPGDPVDPCTPDLEPGYPSFTVVDPGDDIYEDYITLESLWAPGLQMPIRTVLQTLDPAPVYSLNPDGGGGSPPTGYWEYSLATHEGTTSADDILDLGEKIARRWQFAAEGGSTFEFWVDVFVSGSPKGDLWLGQLYFSPGSGTKDTGDQGPEEGFVLDDGTAEIHAGSTSGAFIIANRFSTSASVSLRAVSFYTSGAAAGDEAEVIIYEDPSGEAGRPAPSMEVWREAIVLDTGGFQEVPVEGCPVLNAAPGAAFFVALENRVERSYSLGVDMSGPCAGASYVSIDGGSTFDPISSMPIIDGNAMVRAHEKPAESCFIGVAMNLRQPEAGVTIAK